MIWWLSEVLEQAATRFDMEAVTRAVRVNHTCEPNPVLHAQYAEKAAVYAEVYPTLKGLNRKLWLGRTLRSTFLAALLRKANQ